jgi:hypothetical protein
MMTMTSRAKVGINKQSILSLPIAAVCLSILTGCAASSDAPAALEAQNSDISQDENGSSSTPAFTPPSSVNLPAGSSAFGVVTASLLMASGDVNNALESGQVTPSEVKYAALAVEEGTLDQWRMLAEKE